MAYGVLYDSPCSSATSGLGCGVAPMYPAMNGVGEATGQPSDAGTCQCDGYDRTAVHVVVGVMLLGLIGSAILAASGSFGDARPRVRNA